MTDFATLPGGIYMGTDGNDSVDADRLFPRGIFDNLILTFGGNDTVKAGKGFDAADLGAGDDSGLGSQGNDTLLGGTGNDSLDGAQGRDVLDGGDGNDVISGGQGDDRLSGGAGSDIIAGGDGKDLIIGGSGDDVMAGGKGQDVFLFESGFGKDVVLDFQKGDTIAIQANINGTGITKAADLAGYVSGNAASSTITIGDDTIKLVGVSKSDLLAHLNDYVKIV
ncbi:calcium-binding protein [Falsiroseomonas sp. HW251]|uniref:calcium-binding protein n=1 Tax=Falsiroseomonas sp. HW251 TaxID=3390998 RepID=UPI003D31CB10